MRDFEKITALIGNFAERRYLCGVIPVAAGNGNIDGSLSKGGRCHANPERRATIFSMNYIFDTALACRYGVDEAIMLQNIIFWVAKNKANGAEEHDGRVWTYNSATAFAKLFPFWSAGQIRRILKSLVEQGAVVTGDYNEDRRNRSLWYALSDDLSYLADAISENGNCISRNQQMQLPETRNEYTNIKANIKEDTLFSLRSKSVKRTSEKLCLFVDSKFYDPQVFAAEFSAPEFAGIDLGFYFYQIRDWSSAGGKKKHDWIATARNWIRSDIQSGKVKRLSNGEDIIREYMEDSKQWKI